MLAIDDRAEEEGTTPQKNGGGLRRLLSKYYFHVPEGIHGPSPLSNDNGTSRYKVRRNSSLVKTKGNLPLFENRVIFGVPMATSKLRIKTNILQEANRSWSHISDTTRLIWPQVDKKRSGEWLNFSRKNISNIVKFSFS